MRQKLRSTVGVVLLFLTACGQVEWRKSGATPAEDLRDKRECAYEADKATAGMSGSGFAVAFKQQDLIAECLQLRGYAHVHVNRQ